jgi:hypothetical protein
MASAGSWRSARISARAMSARTSSGLNLPVLVEVVGVGRFEPDRPGEVGERGLVFAARPIVCAGTSPLHYSSSR